MIGTHPFLVSALAVFWKILSKKLQRRDIHIISSITQLIMVSLYYYYFLKYHFPLLHYPSQFQCVLASGSFKAGTAVITNLETVMRFTRSTLLCLFPPKPVSCYLNWNAAPVIFQMPSLLKISRTSACFFI